MLVGYIEDASHIREGITRRDCLGEHLLDHEQHYSVLKLRG
jgi:hypothetical protein